MLCVPVFIFTSSSSALLGRLLWFIDLTVATCHIQYTFLSLCQFFSQENGQNTKILKVADNYYTFKALILRDPSKQISKMCDCFDMSLPVNSTT